MRGGGAGANLTFQGFFNLRNLNYRVAFTLSEVLITLGIIGIVAAMTLPALITRNQNKALEASLKKNYAVIQQALEMYQAEHGERLTSKILTSRAGGVTLYTEIKPYFKIIHDCGQAGSREKACIPYYSNPGVDERNSNAYLTYNKTPLTRLTLFDDGQFILSDGSLIMIENGDLTRNLLYISVDVNGYRKNPNRWGHDLFTFQLMDDGRILPMGAPDTTFSQKNTYCSISSQHEYNGAGCTYYALTEKDYFNNLPR